MPKWSRLVMSEKRVVSWPPCWVAVEVKATPTLPFSAPRAHRPAGPVEKGCHLRREPPVADTGPDDDGVVGRQFLDRGDRGRLVELVAALAGHLLRHSFGNALHVDFGPSGARPFGDGISHTLDVAVARVIENEHLGHVRLSIGHG